MRKFITALFLIAGMTAMAQSVIVKDTTITTYAYSDPDPIPRTGKIYPYERFQTFDNEGTPKTWKMVVLENEFLRVKIFPQIGGKIWSIYDKTAKNELFYDNKVIKFRDIAMRGPWTSGGIEFNYGIIGHAPSCSHPVDYKTEKKSDGSVSCYIGVTELLTRTRWMVEINLPKNAVWLRTRSFWHNYSGTFQPYYTWANSGVTASDDLKLIYPGPYSIGHEGEVESYPIDSENHNMSNYNEQAFGIDKSLHVCGSQKGYFGVYWQKNDCGMLHFALRDEKLGRKFFSWAQSEQGSIWKDLLTDTNPQYVELQSGRLFNQNSGGSVQTPFKQFFFTPFGTDEWNDYWLPFSHIGNVDNMTLRAVTHIEKQNGKTKVGIYPLQALQGKLLIKDKQGKELASENVNLAPAKAFNKEFSLTADVASISIDNHEIWSADNRDTDRPNTILKDFKLNTAQGYMTHGRYLAGMREYREAEEKVDSALAKDPTLLDALNLKAMLCLQRMDYQNAYDYAGKALAIDTYNPTANYINGLAAWKLNKDYNAMDRFELAALTSELRSAAYTRLAEIHFTRGDRELAADYAKKSLVGNQYNITALKLLYQCNPDEQLLSQIESLDRLSHYPDAERLLAGKITAETFDKSISEELHWQNYLEFAIFFHRLGLDQKAINMLKACPSPNALVSLWMAFLKNDKAAIATAEKAAIDRVFPFREESYEPLKWAVDNGGKWQSRYLLAMLLDFRQNKNAARLLLEKDDSSDFAPYYAYRYTLNSKVEELEKAHQLDPKQWRYICDLGHYYIIHDDCKKALSILGPYYNANKKNCHVACMYIQALMDNNNYAKADQIISSLEVLPFEGQSDTHTTYHNIKMALAKQCLAKKQYKKAIRYAEEAKLWPKNLGVGKPYEVNTEEEDNFIKSVQEKMK